MSVSRAQGVGDPAFFDLSAPVRARSILLSTHQLLVEELSPTAAAQLEPPSPSTAPVLYGFVAVDAVPYLVSLGGDDVRPGPLLAFATGTDARLGTLQVVGELGEWTYPSSDLRIAAALEDHRECMTEPVRDLMEILRLRVAPLSAIRIWTSPPGSSTPTAIEPTCFAAAEPDPWAAFLQEAMRHLNEHHHHDLVELARLSGATSCTAVSLTRLDLGGAILTAISHEGLMDVVIPFDPPAGSPGEAGARLTGQYRGKFTSR